MCSVAVRYYELLCPLAAASRWGLSFRCTLSILSRLPYCPLSPHSPSPLLRTASESCVGLNNQTQLSRTDSLRGYRAQQLILRTSTRRQVEPNTW